MTMHNQHIKEQFNKQAEAFANWCAGRDAKTLQRYFDFCLLKPGARMLDVACGPGDFTLFAAQKGVGSTGVDISDKEIEIARQSAIRLGLDNCRFEVADVEALPFAKSTFSMVVCKSAFHHFSQPDKVFKEMKRCCCPGGRVCIQDIVAYSDDYVNCFFEKFDHLIDISHNKALTYEEFRLLYTNNRIGWVRDYKLSVEMKVHEYIGHAHQKDEVKAEIEELVAQGLADKKLSSFLYKKDEAIYFLRPVYMIIGRRQGA